MIGSSALLLSITTQYFKKGNIEATIGGKTLKRIKRKNRIIKEMALGCQSSDCMSLTAAYFAIDGEKTNRIESTQFTSEVSCLWKFGKHLAALKKNLYNLRLGPKLLNMVMVDVRGDDGTVTQLGQVPILSKAGGVKKKTDTREKIEVNTHLRFWNNLLKQSKSLYGYFAVIRWGLPIQSLHCTQLQSRYPKLRCGKTFLWKQCWR